MKETIEHNNRFYGEELKTESEQYKEWLVIANKEIERLNNIINKAIDKAKTMKASMLLDTIDGIEIDSKFIGDLFALIDFMEKELKGDSSNEGRK